MFNEVADIAQVDLVNSMTFKDLWNKIQGLSSTCPVFKDFQGLEFRIKKFKYFQRLSRMRGNPVITGCLHLQRTHKSTDRL